MWRSSESGKMPLNGLYERERLRRMAKKLGLRLLKFDHSKSAAGADKPAGRSDTRRTDRPAGSFAIDERAS